MQRFIASFALLLILGSLGLAYYSDIIGLAKEDKMVVEVLLLMFAVALVLQIILTIIEFSRYLAKRREKGEKIGSFITGVKGALKTNEAIFLAVTAPYIILFPKIGFFVSTFIYVLVGNILLGTKGKFKLIAIPAGTAIFTYLLFVLLLDVNLPHGILF